jgi:predicted HTH transcriptional regulator
VDFKRELNLESSEEKSEFVKDLIAIANSVPEKGYLIIGIDDAKTPLGIKSLDEERIQQIAHAYIFPSLVIQCYVRKLDPILLGIIEIIPTEKPHQVIKSIGRLLLNDVFIRHGSITVKTSPSEISRMREKGSELSREILQLSWAAEKHLQLGNIDQTISSYTKAIDLMPSAEPYWQEHNHIKNIFILIVSLITSKSRKANYR